MSNHAEEDTVKCISTSPLQLDCKTERRERVVRSSGLRLEGCRVDVRTIFVLNGISNSAHTVRISQYSPALLSLVKLSALFSMKPLLVVEKLCI
jgi:hypothetical protein